MNNFLEQESLAQAKLSFQSDPGLKTHQSDLVQTILLEVLGDVRLYEPKKEGFQSWFKKRNPLLLKRSYTLATMSQIVKHRETSPETFRFLKGISDIFHWALDVTEIINACF